MSSTSDLNEQSSPSSRSRPRYHYFYGATEPSPSISESSLTRLSSAETDTLFGESLIPTDTEEETPTNSVQDLTQIVVTNGQGVGGSHQRTYLLEPYIDDHSVSLSNSNHSKAFSNHGGETINNGRSSSRQDGFWSDPCQNIGGNRPVGHVTRVILLLGIAICMFTLINVLAPADATDQSGMASGSGGQQIPFSIPLPVVDRANYNDPAAGIVNTKLFHDSIVFRAGRKGGSDRSVTGVDPLLRVPFPTGAFWTNLVMEPTDDGLSYPIVSYPYAFKWSSSVLQVSYPPVRRRVKKLSIRDIFEPDVTFSSVEKVDKRVISSFDPLSVTLTFSTENGGFWETYIVQGTPYITVKYKQATPVLRALSTFLNVMCPFNEDGKYFDGEVDMSVRHRRRRLKWGVCIPAETSKNIGTQTATLYGVQFLLQTQEDLTWILFASEPIALTFDSEKRTTVSASRQFTGVLRLALIPPTPESASKDTNSTTLLPLSESSGLVRLVYHSGIYPVGGSVKWDFHATQGQSTAPLTIKSVAGISATRAFGAGRAPSSLSSTLLGSSSTRAGTVRFEYETLLMNDNLKARSNAVNSQLLMLALPHHREVLRQDALLSETQFDLRYESIKGRMTAVVGSTWSYEESLPDIDFEVSRKLDFAPEVMASIMDNVKKDLEIILPSESENIYGYGKQTARLAQLAHIADVVTRSLLKQQSNSTTMELMNYKQIRTAAIKKLAYWLELLFGGSVADELLYDGKFGGVVSRNGLVNPSGDFGNGRYSDHHLHYGYLLYASAVMGALNASFVHEYGSMVDTLLYDIAYRGNGESKGIDGAFFPLARHKSWYDGHSYASGLFPFANGKCQESTSEATNAYFSAYLWSKVRQSTTDEVPTSSFADFARLLMAMEIRGAQTYWHMIPSTANISLSKVQIYDDSFASNYMVGNLGMLDAVSETWFGNASLFVHMINFLPITAATELLFQRAYVHLEYQKVIEPLKGQIPMAWRGYTICDQAILDPPSAWKGAQTLRSAELDSALSKSQVLFWISTRPGFTFSPTSDADSIHDNPSRPSSPSKPSSLSQCKYFVHCVGLNLTGSCCPTIENVMLECCMNT